MDRPCYYLETLERDSGVECKIFRTSRIVGRLVVLPGDVVLSCD